MNRRQTITSIRGAWIAALICAFLTACVSVAAYLGLHIGNSSAAGLIDVVIVGALCYGISRASRTSAVIMFLYYTVSRVALLAVTKSLVGAVVTIVFVYFFGRGVLGTFSFHRKFRRKKFNLNESVQSQKA